MDAHKSSNEDKSSGRLPLDDIPRERRSVPTPRPLHQYRRVIDIRAPCKKSQGTASGSGKYGQLRVPHPELFPLDITDDTMTEVERKLSGGLGPGGLDLVSMQHWILQFGEGSAKLHLIFALITEWFVNKLFLWE